MPRTKTLLAILLTLALGAVAPTAASADPTWFGFNDSAVAYGQTTAANDAALASQAGANTSRVTFDWRWAEPTQGAWQMASYDAIYQADIAKGIRPVFVLLNSPMWTWAAGTPCVQWTQDCHYPPGPNHLDAWRNVVTKLVTRYPKMAALEIWNEPNLTGFWQSGPDPSYYTTLLQQAHDTVKGLGSTVPVISAGLAPTNGPSDSAAMNFRSFLGGMYAAGAKGDMDGLGLHPYPGDIDLGQFFKMLTEARAIRDANGDSVPLWITETGASTVGGQFSENDQALLLQKLYTELAGMSDVRAVIFHTLVDPSIFGATDPERGYGVMHGDLSPKPAYCALASLRGTGFVCPATVAPVVADPTQALRWTAQDYVQAAADAARAYRKTNGSYFGLTPAILHTINPSLSATGADSTLAPGPSADPSRIGVWVWGTAGQEKLLLCNTSQSDRSYCIYTQVGQPWSYGMAVGNANSAAGATSTGTSTSW